MSDRDSSVVFVFNLPLGAEAHESELRAVLSSYGSTGLVRFPYVDNKKCYAFVTMSTPQEAQNVIEKSGTIDFRGNKICFDWAVPKKSTSTQEIIEVPANKYNKYTVFVGGLPEEAQPHMPELTKILSQFGRVLGTSVPTSKKHIAFVAMSTPKEAESVVALHKILMFHNSALTLEFAKLELTPENCFNWKPDGLITGQYPQHQHQKCNSQHQHISEPSVEPGEVVQQSNTVIVDGLTVEAQESDILRLMSKFGVIQRINFMKTVYGGERKIASVTMGSTAAAEAVVSQNKKCQFHGELVGFKHDSRQQDSEWQSGNSLMVRNNDGRGRNDSRDRGRSISHTSREREKDSYRQSRHVEVVSRNDNNKRWWSDSDQRTDYHQHHHSADWSPRRERSPMRRGDSRCRSPRPSSLHRERSPDNRTEHNRGFPRSRSPWSPPPPPHRCMSPPPICHTRAAVNPTNSALTTRYCFDFQNKGVCPRGSTCPFRHDSYDATRDRAGCFSFKHTGHCERGDSCRYAHISPVTAVAQVTAQHPATQTPLAQVGNVGKAFTPSQTATTPGASIPKSIPPTITKHVVSLLPPVEPLTVTIPPKQVVCVSPVTSVVDSGANNATTSLVEQSTAATTITIVVLKPVTVLESVPLAPPTVANNQRSACIDLYKDDDAVDYNSQFSDDGLVEGYTPLKEADTGAEEETAVIAVVNEDTAVNTDEAPALQGAAGDDAVSVSSAGTDNHRDAQECSMDTVELPAPPSSSQLPPQSQKQQEQREQQEQEQEQKEQQQQQHENAVTESPAMKSGDVGNKEVFVQSQPSLSEETVEHVEPEEPVGPTSAAAPELQQRNMNVPWEVEFVMPVSTTSCVSDGEVNVLPVDPYVSALPNVPVTATAEAPAAAAAAATAAFVAGVEKSGLAESTVHQKASTAPRPSNLFKSAISLLSKHTHSHAVAPEPPMITADESNGGSVDRQQPPIETLDHGIGVHGTNSTAAVVIGDDGAVGVKRKRDLVSMLHPVLPAIASEIQPLSVSSVGGASSGAHWKRKLVRQCGEPKSVHVV